MMVPKQKKCWPIILPLYAFAGGGWMQYPEHALSLFACSSVILWICSIAFSKTNEGGLILGSRLTMGLLYIPFMLSQLLGLRESSQGLALIFFCLVCTWAADTGAYFAGRALGQRKLAPRLSPNKTWEGAIGGAIAAVLGAVIMNHYVLSLPMTHIIILALLLDVVSVLGDLFESMLKRAVNIKDSGWIMPGHGGVLDRIDSLLFTGPVALAYLAYFTLI